MKWMCQLALATSLLCSTVVSWPEPQFNILETPTDRARELTFGDIKYFRGTLRLQPFLEPGRATSCVNDDGINLFVPNYFILPDGRISRTKVRGSRPAFTQLHAVSVPRELGYLCGRSVRIALTQLPSPDTKRLTYTWGVVWDICEECDYVEDGGLIKEPARATIKATPDVWQALGQKPDLDAPQYEAVEVYWAPFNNLTPDTRPAPLPPPKTPESPKKTPGKTPQ